MRIFRKTTILITLGITILFAISCKQSSPFKGYTEERPGVYYKFHTTNEKAAKLEYGDRVNGYGSIYHNDTMLLVSTEGKVLTLFELDSSNVLMYNILKKCHLGDSISIKILADTLEKVGNQRLGKDIKPTDYITFTYKIVEKKSQAELIKEIEEQEQAYNAAELEGIKKYMQEHKLTADPTNTGLIYIETKKGTGKEAVAGKAVKINYAGYTLDGKLFDTNIKKIAQEEKLDRPGEYKPLEFTMGMVGQRGGVIAGMDEGVSKMKVGGKAKLIIPAHLGYGPQMGTMVFDVELVEVLDAPTQDPKSIQ